MLTCSLLALASPALAQEDDAGEAPIILYHEPADTFITVLATGQREPLSGNGLAVSVFDRAAIESVQGPDLTRLLERAPGVTLSRNGPAGSFTALRVRGAEAEQLLVLVDGVPLADPAAPAAGFDLGTLTLGALAKVELQRSANSTLWGSQALGGVLAITSDTSITPAAALEYGAFDSLYATARGGVAMGPLDLAVAGGWRRSDGFSAAAAGTEADGHRQLDLSARAEADLGSGLAAFAQGRFADARLEYDGFPAPAYTLADTDEYQDTRQLSGSAGLEYNRHDLTLRASFAGADTERQNFDPAFGTAPSYTTDGTTRRADLRGQAQVAEGIAINFGAMREWTSFATLYDARRRTASSAAFAQVELDRDEWHVALGLRREEHRAFGGAWSLGADLRYDLPQGFALTASYGEGFKAPSLFQLFSDFGNAALRPERAQSFDAGLVYAQGPVSLALRGFHRDTHDQIVYESCFGVSTGICTNRPFGTYDNRGLTRAQGIEAEGRVTVADGVALGAVYSLADTRDRTPGSFTLGNALARRPRHAATLSAEWEPLERIALAADLRLVSQAFDDGFNTVRLDGYQLLTLRGSWDVADQVQVYARIENLTDEAYQTAAGYAQSGRAAYVGARLRL